MTTLRQFFARPVVHLTMLTALLGLAFSYTHIIPLDDHFLYQRFIESLGHGKLDFSIPGFHGASFLALPIYLLTGSPLSSIYLQIFCALLIPVMAFLAVTALLKDRALGLLAAYAFAMMPFFTFIEFRGFTFAAYTFLVLLTLFLRAKGSRWAWLPWSISVITKPFSIALLPFFLLWEPEGKPLKGNSRGWVQALLMLIIPVLYVLIEYFQVGHIIIGAHADIDQSNVFTLLRFPLNALHGVQMLLSVHNFYFPDPAKTGQGNLVHTSPLLIVFGIWALLYNRKFFDDRRLPLALGLSALSAFVLAALLDHMDHFYMETCVLLLVIAAMPFLKQYLLMIPFVLLTLHFQFFYLYLNWSGTYFTDYTLFVIPAVIDFLFVVMLVVYPKLWRSALDQMRE